MRLAVNQSDPALQLFSNGEAHFDLIKCAWFENWMHAASSQAPIYVHFPFLTGPEGVFCDDGRGLDWNLIKRALDETESTHLNLHLFADPRRFHPDDPLAPCEIEEMLLLCIGRMHQACPDTPIIVENVVSRAGGKLCHIHATRPDVISSLVDKTGCGLLLDTAHLRITCIENNLDWKTALDAMPLDSLVEWHVCGCQIPERDSCFYDSMPMTDDDWQITRDVADRISLGAARKPDLVALEYGGIGDKFSWRTDAAILEQDINHLASLLSCL